MGKNSRKMIAFHLATYICLCCCSCVQRRRIEKKPEVVSRPSRREEHAKEQQQEPLRAEENYTSSFRVQILAYWIFFLANSTTTRRHSHQSSLVRRLCFLVLTDAFRESVALLPVRSCFFSVVSPTSSDMGPEIGPKWSHRLLRPRFANKTSTAQHCWFLQSPRPGRHGDKLLGQWQEIVNGNHVTKKHG